MKKTCWNCIHYHAMLEEPNVFFHIHDYCDAWNKSESCLMHSKLNEFLDDEASELGEDLFNLGGIYDDFEIGLAGCYRFKVNDDADFDTKMKENFEHNKELALKVVNAILKKLADGKGDDKDFAYYTHCKEEIESMRFED